MSGDAAGEKAPPEELRPGRGPLSLAALIARSLARHAAIRGGSHAPRPSSLLDWKRKSHQAISTRRDSRARASASRLLRERRPSPGPSPSPPLPLVPVEMQLLLAFDRGHPRSSLGPRSSNPTIFESDPRGGMQMAWRDERKGRTADSHASSSGIHPHQPDADFGGVRHGFSDDLVRVGPPSAGVRRRRVLAGRRQAGLPLGRTTSRGRHRAGHGVQHRSERSSSAGLWWSKRHRGRGRTRPGSHPFPAPQRPACRLTARNGTSKPMAYEKDDLASRWLARLAMGWR